MTTPISLQTTIKAGTCPHGLPQGACPICSKQQAAAMGSGTVMKHSKPSGEWSYQKCYIVGRQIQAAMQRREDAQTFLQKQTQFFQQLNKNIQNVYDKLNAFVQNIKSPIIQNTLQTVMNNILNPAFNSINKLINKISEFNQKAYNIIHQAAEQLANVLGEVKNFIQRKIVEDFKKKAKKFMLFCLSVIDDENYQNDETLAVFKSIELKKFVTKILKKRDKNEHRSSQSE